MIRPAGRGRRASCSITGTAGIVGATALTTGGAATVAALLALIGTTSAPCGTFGG